MLKFILIGIVVTAVFAFLRSKILLKVKDTAKENFDTKKLRAGLFRITDKVSWIKDIVQLFNLRRIVIYLTIAATIYGIGVYRGKLGKPVQINLDYEKEFTLQLDGEYLHKPRDSSQLNIIDEGGNVVKEIKVKDFPLLKEKLKPFGFQIVPIFVSGYGIGKDDKDGEFGAGITWLRYFQWRIDNFITQKGIYLGTSYKFKSLENSAIGIAMGKDWDVENRMLVYWKWRF